MKSRRLWPLCVLLSLVAAVVGEFFLPEDVPGPPEKVLVSPASDTALRVQLFPPLNVKPEGVNGAPVLGYKVEVAHRVNEVQTFAVTANGPLLAGGYKLQFQNAISAQVSSCISWNASDVEFEMVLEEMSNVDSVAVTRSGYDSVKNGYVYTVTFDGDYLVSGPQAQTIQGDTTGCLPTQPLNRVLSFEGAHVTTGVAGFRPGVWEIVSSTDGTDMIGGSFDVSVGFKGNWISNSGNNKATVAAGSKTADTTGYSMLGLVNRGDWIRIAGEVFTVHATAPFTDTELPLDSYHVRGATLATIELMDTALGNVQVTTSSTTVSTSSDFRTMIAAGEQIRIGKTEFGVVNVFPTYLTIDAAWSDGSTLHVTAFKRKKTTVSSSADAADMKRAISSLPGAGSVEVSRTGPTKENGYHWHVTFESIESINCPASPCLRADIKTGDISFKDLFGVACPNCNVAVSAVNDATFVSIESPIKSDFGGNAIVASQELGGAVQEVQAISTTAKANDISGSFTVTFRSSSGVVIDYNDTGVDVRTKLQNLATVGRLNVTRTDNANFGARWSITFLSNMGDLPMLVVSDKSLLKGTGADVVVQEIVKGADVAFETIVDGLVSGYDYYVRAFARNENGYGASTIDYQQTGRGALPLLTSVATSPDAPSVTGMWPISGSQLELRLSSPVDHGDPVSKYILEYAVGSSFGTPATKKLRIFSLQQDDIAGTFQLQYGDDVSAMLPVHTTASSLQEALSSLPCMRPVSVTRAVYVLARGTASTDISFSAPGNSLTTTALTAAQVQLLVKGAVLNVDGNFFVVSDQPQEGSTSIDVELGNGVSSFTSATSILKIDNSGNEHGPYGYEWTISFDNDPNIIIAGTYPGLQLLSSMTTVETGLALPASACTIVADQAAVPANHYGFFEINNDEDVCDTYVVGEPSAVQVIRLFAKTTITGGSFKLTLGGATSPCITQSSASSLKAALTGLGFASKVTVEEVRGFKVTLLTGSASSKVTGYSAGSITVVSGDTTVSPHGGLTAGDVAVLLQNTAITVSRNPNDFSKDSCEFSVNSAPSVGDTTIAVTAVGSCNTFTGEARSLKILDFNDYKVRFWGNYPTGEWPTLQFDPSSFGTAPCAPWTTNAAWTNNIQWAAGVPVYGQIHTLKYEGACAHGRQGIQTILADAASSIGGTFTLSYMGEETTPLLFQETGASEMRDAIDSITAPGTVDVSVSNYGSYGKAWHVTFIQEDEDQDAIFVHHSHLTGQDALISVYPTVTVFTDAKQEDASDPRQNDISGSFRIAFGGEVTEPIGFSATHKKVVQELQKLSSVDSVLALGDLNAGDVGVYALELTADATQNPNVLSNVRLGNMVIDPTRFLAVGESVVVASGTANNIASITSVDITLTNPVGVAAGTLNVNVAAGLITKQTKPLPGFVSTSYLMQVISVAQGSNVFELPASHGFVSTNTFFVGNVQFTVSSVNGALVTVTPAYSGDSVVGASPQVYLFDNMLRTTEDLTNLVAVGDDLWLRSESGDMTKFTISAENSRYLAVTGGSFTNSIAKQRVYHVSNGQKWNLVFRSYDGSLDTVEAIPMFDWRGTAARIGTRSPKSVPPNVINVGNPASIQTAILNVVSPTTYSLSFAGESTASIAWNTLNNDMKTTLESLDAVDGVSVASTQLSGSVVHTISFWGVYPMTKLPLLVITPDDVTKLNAVVRSNGAMAVTKQDNLILESSQDYAFRIFAVNSKGISDSVSVFQAQTAASSVLPTPPTGVALGEFHGPTWLSINYWAPLYSGGADITMYRIEWDFSPNFDSTSADYGVASIQKKFEVQQVTTSYRSATGVKGAFTLSWGGHTTTPLPFDCSADVMKTALSVITGTSDIAVDPVDVTRAQVSWGYAWKITFTHNPGDLALLVANASLLEGDFPQINVVEVVQGVNDLAIGDFTHEVQEVFTDDVSPISGTFTLTFNGKTTGAISVAASSLEMQTALQQTTTLYSIKVTKATRSSIFNTAIWTVTFAYLRGEEMVGAGNIFTMTVDSTFLTGTNPTVQVANKITGSDPFRFYLTGLRPGVKYYAHLMAYNADGFGSATSPLATAVTCGQPDAPQTVTASVVDGTTLAVEWGASTLSGDLCSVDKYKVEWYRAEGTQEQQMITTSAGKGLPEIQRLVDFADSQTLSGYFKLSFGGEVTENLQWNAQAIGLKSVKERLERLSTIGTVDVSRVQSSRVVSGVLVSVTTTGTVVTASSTTPLTVSSTLALTNAGLQVGDTIWIAGLQRTIASISLSAGTFTVGTTITQFTNPVPLFKSAFGYSWAITFLAGHIGPQDLIQVYPSDNWAGTNPGVYVESVQKGLQPISGTFRVAFASEGLSDTTPPLPHNISADDLQNALEGLITIGAVNVTRSSNGYGYNWMITFVSEFKDAISLLNADDTELQGPGAKIMVSRTLVGVQPSFYCERNGAPGDAGVVAVPGQLRYVIQGLTTGQKYAIRVRAHSDEGYGYVASIPSYQIPRSTPSAPVDAQLLALSSKFLKVRWSTPTNIGGTYILSYKIQWATSIDFSSGIQENRYLVGPQDSGPFYFNIPVTSGTNYFVRLNAVNSQGDGPMAIPNPSSVKPSDRTPGQPEEVAATAMSSNTIFVEWQPSSTDTFAYGGDGGLSITQYMIEWDISSTFDSPAAFALVSGTKRSFIIGGDDVVTGVRSDVLVTGYSYCVRVTAFNAKGASVPAPASPSSVIVTNQPPTPPQYLNLSVASATSVKAQWTNPLFDGGASLKSYEIEWDDQDDFSSGQSSSATVPIVREMQSIMLQSNVVNEEQFVDATVKVVNEEQVVRTTFTGVDEIQLIKTTNNALVDEIQQVVTSATDRDEVQELRLDGNDVDEIQAIRTIIPDTLEVQQIQVGVARISEVQSITFLLSGAAASPQPSITGSLFLSFDSSICTHCVSKMYQRTTDLISAVQPTGTAQMVKNALMALANIDNVDVTRTSSDAGNVRTIVFSIIFSGNAVAGNVPTIGIDSSITVGGAQVGGIPTAATEVTAGSEVAYNAASVFTVTYTCESYSDPYAITTFSTPCTPASTDGICTGCVTAFDGTTFTISQSLAAATYVATGAKLIAGVCSFEAGVVTNLANSATITVPLTDVGKYCSSFSSQTFNLYKAPRFSTDIPLKTAQNTISSGSVVGGLLTGPIDSVTITRSESISSAFVGSVYTVTFRKRSGSVPLLACSTPVALSPPVLCPQPTRITIGSMITGTFTIGLLSQDNAALIASNPSVNPAPTPQYTSAIPWDASEATMKAILEGTLTTSGNKMLFGTVSVKRTVYSQTGTKWSGGFTWQITFTSRGWNIPRMVTTSTLTSPSSDAITISTEDATHPLNPFANSRDGNQVGGSMTLKFGDVTSSIPCQIGVSTVLQSPDLRIEDTLMESFMLTQFNIHTAVWRSPATQARGFTWTIIFSDPSTPGNLGLIKIVSSQLTGAGVRAAVFETVKGNQIGGTFQLSFNGETTEPISYAAADTEMQTKLNKLSTIKPSKVIVQRGAPTSNQVFGYTWYITFYSSVWVDPTSDHSRDVPGNWVGSSAAWDDVWESGYSKAWGRHVGHTFPLTCIKDGLTTTANDATLSCVASVKTLGVGPIAGTFTVTLNSGPPSVNHMAIKGSMTSPPIPHNAWGSKQDSGNTGTSVEEILEQMANIGDVAVSRTTIPDSSGGYEWTVTFLRDASDSAHPCEQLDDSGGAGLLCNSPGNVPLMVANPVTLSITTYPLAVASNPRAAVTLKQNGAILRGDFTDFRVQGDAGTSQRFTVTVACSNNVGTSCTVTYFTIVSGGQMMATHLLPQDRFTVGTSSCIFQVASVDVVAGHVNVNSKACADFDSTTTSAMGISMLLPWNADETLVQRVLEAATTVQIPTTYDRKVNVDRGIIGKYGEMSWLVRFISNPGFTPPGAGNIPNIVTSFTPETGSSGYAVTVTQVTPGSQGLSGTFLLDFRSSSFDPRVVPFDEDPDRLQKKLSEMDTIGDVSVIRLEYPSTVTGCTDSLCSGGWDDTPVNNPGTRGGYRWKIRFVQVTGEFNGFTFPPGSGNVAPLSVTFPSLTGNGASVDVYTNTQGSSPILGTFTLNTTSNQTPMLPYSSSVAAIEKAMEGMGLFGEVNVAQGYLMTQKILGATATLAQDGSFATITGIDDIRQFIAPGDNIRFGSSAIADTLIGSNGDTPFTQVIDTSRVNVLPQSPLVYASAISSMRNLYPGKLLRIDGLTYQVQRSGSEVQIITVTVSVSSWPPSSNSFQLQLTRGGIQSTSSTALPFNAAASSVHDALYGLLYALDATSQPEDIVVSRAGPLLTSSGTRKGYIYYVYFLGDSVAGDVALLTASAVTAPTTVVIAVVTHGGQLPHQRLSLATESGQVTDSQGYYQLSLDNAIFSSCIEWGAPASDLEAALETQLSTGNVIVTRSGNGTSQTEIQRIRMTSNTMVTSTAGLFRLQFTLNGQTAATPAACLPYGISDEDLQSALNALGNLGNLNNVPHINVTRDGDGSSDWGYGYEYLINFRGPLSGGYSRVVGNVSQLEVGICSSGMVAGVYPTITAETIREGSAGFTYDIFFLDYKLTSYVSRLFLKTKDNDNVCAAVSQTGGSVRKISVKMLEFGGSREVQALTITDTTISGGYKLQFAGTSTWTSCIPFTATATDLTSALVLLSHIGAGGVMVSRDTNPLQFPNGYIYRITFVSDLVTGNIPLMQAQQYGTSVCAIVVATTNVGIGSVVDGGISTEEFSLTSVYDGENAVDTHIAYSVSQPFSVMSDLFEIQQLTITNPNNNIALTATYTLTVLGTTTTPIPWNADEIVLQTAIQTAIYTTIPAVSDGDVVVTRRTDSNLAPLGFIYTIYFSGATLAGNLPAIVVVTPATAPNIDSSNVIQSTVRNGVDGAVPLSANSIPLATPSDSTISSRFLSSVPQQTLDIYKVNGFLWTIKFKSFLGNVPKLGTQTDTLTGGTVTIVDDFVPGSASTSYTIPNLLAGINYYVHVAASTDVGIGAFTAPASIIPSDTASAVQNIEAGYALYKREVQEVRLAATHVAEIQAITTQAASIPEVQTLQTFETPALCPGGLCIQGSIAYRVPTVQTITIWSTATILSGTFTLSFVREVIDVNHPGSFKSIGVPTTAIPWNAPAGTVKSALTSAAGAAVTPSDIVVTRDGDASVDFNFGYVFQITFIGNAVAGETQPIVCTDSFTTTGGAQSDCTVAMNTDNAMGTDTGIQQVIVAAKESLVAGSYSLTLNFLGAQVSSICIPFDAPANVMRSSLEGMTNIDKVYVSRDAYSTNGFNGFVYSIFFHGNGVYSNVAQLGYSVCSGGAFQTLQNNVMTAVAASDKQLQTSIVSKQFVSAASIQASTADQLAADLNQLPVFGDVFVSQSLMDDQGGYIWTVVFDASEGDVPQFICAGNTAFTQSGAQCVTNTLSDGNVLSGSFFIESSDPIPFNADAPTMKAALEAMSWVGTVQVTQSAPSPQLGYTWSITFLDYQGDVPALVVTSSLVGTGSQITVQEVRKGNALGGTFTLAYLGSVTTPIQWNALATAADSNSDGSSLEEKLEALAVIGKLSVQRSASADSEGGYAWTVTFLDNVLNSGDLPLMQVGTNSLTGEGAVVFTKEITKGSNAVGNQLWLSFDPPATDNGSPITKYQVRWDTSSTFTTSPADVFISDPEVLYRTQYITTSGPSLAWSSVKLASVNAVQKLTITTIGPFSLSLRGDSTAPIPAGSIAAITANSLQAALQAVPSIGLVDVVPTANAGEFQITFKTLPGALPLMQIVPGTGSPVVGTVVAVTAGVTNFRKEVVVFSCVATAGTVKFTFGITTPPVEIAFNALLSAVGAQLTTMLGVEAGSVNVYSAQALLCGATVSAAKDVRIVFDRVYGNVNLAVAQGSATGSNAVITANTAASIDGVFNDNPALTMSGTFQVGYQDSYTQPLNAASSADQLRYALEDLDTVQTVGVSRDQSYQALPGKVDVTEDEIFVTCSSGEVCGFASANYGLPGYMIRIGGDWYTIRTDLNSPGLHSTRLYLGDLNGREIGYLGSTDTFVTVYEWAKGYVWTIDMLSVGSPLGYLRPKVPHLSPADSAVQVSGSACNKCYYLPTQTMKRLTMGQQYYIEVYAYNGIGKGDIPTGDPATATPSQVPSAPSNVNLAVVSGQQIEVFFSPPPLATANVSPNFNNDISSYVVQWDTTSNFRHGRQICASCATQFISPTLTVTTPLSNLLTSGSKFTIGDDTCVLQVAGSILSQTSVTVLNPQNCLGFSGQAYSLFYYTYQPVTLSGPSISGSPPIRYVISSLTPAITYYVQVSAMNSVPVQQIALSGDPPNNRRWSYPLSATTQDQVPDPPLSVFLYPFSASTLELQIQPSTRDGIGTGGAGITAFWIDVDTVSTFDSPTKRTPVIMTIGSLPNLYSGGPLIYYVTGLTTGTRYFAQAKTQNYVGYSRATVSPSAQTPTKHPGSLGNVKVSTLTASDNPITTATVIWQMPQDTGGLALTGSRVEWWRLDARPEVQTIELKWMTPPTAAPFKLAFGGLMTASLPMDISADNLRFALMSLASGTNVPVGNIEVSRVALDAGLGYEWSVTFDNTNKNAGDQPMIQFSLGIVNGGSGVVGSLFEATSGISQPVGNVFPGTQEVQVLVTYHASIQVGGYFRLSFRGSTWTNYLSAQVSAADLELALEALPTVGDVTVNLEVMAAYTFGQVWTITFESNVGNLPALIVDSSKITPVAAFIGVKDGDNAVDTNGLLCLPDGIACPGSWPSISNVIQQAAPMMSIAQLATPGEAAVDYGYYDTLDPRTLTYTILNLTPGQSYQVAVAARNAQGLGTRTHSSPAAVIPPLQVPGPPVNVSVDVNPGVATQLLASWTDPESDGGSPVWMYRVEYDASPLFTDRGQQDVYCPVAPTPAIWTVQTLRTTAASPTKPISNGFFELELTRQNVVQISDPIPWNAAATASDEANSVSSTGSAVFCTTALVSCTSSSTFPYGQLEHSGSIESKFSQFAELTNGVQVTRTASQAGDGGFTWTITFLDGGDDFSLGVQQVTLACDVSADPVVCGATYNVVVTNVRHGVMPTSCVGSQVIPSSGVLNKGQLYYVRVFAYSQVGFGEPTLALAPQKPMVVPGPPNSVTLSVLAATELVVLFSPPDDNGGDTITGYEIQWATDAAFTTPNSALVISASGISAPYRRIITSLTKGTLYYVRVHAQNSQGFGQFQVTSPASQQPYMIPGAPTLVVLGVTSSTMLTVGWAPPLDDGGDTVSGYVVQWDVAPTFDSLVAGATTTATINDATQQSYTITLLTPGTRYYVRVSAMNLGGKGIPQTSTPASLVAATTRPGKPNSLAAAPTGTPGQIQVIWQPPRVPAHGIPCAGSLLTPESCPYLNGLDMVYGGVSLESYLVQYADSSDFSLATEVDSTTTSTVISGLQSGKTYYVRVLTVNSQGLNSDFCARANTQNLLCPDHLVLQDGSVVTGNFVSAVPA